MLAGLFLAQVLSAIILLRDRGQTLYHSMQDNLVERATGIVRLLDTLSIEDRNKLVPLMGGADLRILLSEEPLSGPRMDEQSQRIASALRETLLNTMLWKGRVLVAVESDASSGPMREMHYRHMVEGGMMRGPWMYLHGIHTLGQSFLIQVELTDSSWVRFEHGLPADLFDWPVRLLAVLVVLLVSVVLLSLVGVRSILRPLKSLKNAAEGLGKNIRQTPLALNGPAEIRETAVAFNTMQQRLKNYIEDRANILAAVSHDLKTPLTRIRLRADLMDDGEERTRILGDMDEMEEMVMSTLEFMRGTESEEPSQPLDVMALLESIQDDATAIDGDVRLEGTVGKPFIGKPLALKRCITNLVDNALRYADGAWITTTDSGEKITITVCDNGPGIHDNNLRHVFKPFFRVDSSRAKHTGGTGLGLGIARNIALAHGGNLVLRNREQGGLCAELSLPR